MKKIKKFFVDTNFYLMLPYIRHKQPINKFHDCRKCPYDYTNFQYHFVFIDIGELHKIMIDHEIFDDENIQNIE